MRAKSTLSLLHNPVVPGRIDLAVRHVSPERSAFWRIAPLSADQARDICAGHPEIAVIGSRPAGPGTLSPGFLEIAPGPEGRTDALPWDLMIVRKGSREKICGLRQDAALALTMTDAFVRFSEAQPDWERHNRQREAQALAQDVDATYPSDLTV